MTRPPEAGSDAESGSGNDTGTYSSLDEVGRAVGGTLDRTLITRMGIEVLEASGQSVTARMPVDGNLQPYGVLHGGATAALCETVGSIGASIAAPDRMAMGIELNVNHLRSVGGGSITAVGTVLHSGRTTAVWDVRVTDDDGRLVAVGRLTLAVREVPKG
ncbi:MAG TPA: PaaI family thioesterase [Actinomycetota bacterium]|nr:PaaI family thioesterase [Actinomycetota bacterium]